MEGQFWDVLVAHPFFVIVVVVGGLIAMAAILQAFMRIHDVLGFKTRTELEREQYLAEVQQRNDEHDELTREIKEMRDEFRKEFRRSEEQYQDLASELKCVKGADIMILGDRINSRSTAYLKQGYIPAEEMMEYQGLYDTYKDLGGNHGVDTLFEKTVASLPLRSQEE